VKIAIVMRGPIRPDLKTCIENVHTIKKNFESCLSKIEGEHSVTTFAGTWTGPYNEDINLLKEAVDNLIMIRNPIHDAKELTGEEGVIESKSSKVTGDVSRFKMMYMSSMLITCARTYHLDFDYIVLSRLDASVSSDNICNFLDPDHMCVPKDKFINTTLGKFTDVFAAGPPELMARYWCYPSTSSMVEAIKSGLAGEALPLEVLKLNKVEGAHKPAQSGSVRLSRNSPTFIQAHTRRQI